MKKFRFGYPQFILLAMLTIPANLIFAQEGGRAEFGISSGIGVPDLKNTVGLQVNGIKGSAYITPVWSLGGYYLVSVSNITQGGINWEMTLAGLETAYHIPSAKGDTYLSIRYGVTKAFENQAGVDLVYSPYHLGLAVGYNFKVSEMFAFQFEGANYGAQSGTTTVNGVTYNQDAFNAITFLISVLIRL